MEATTTAAAPAPARLTREEKLLLGAIAYFVLLKLVLAFLTFPPTDEAYYWMWGRHPQLSYFDHPPLGAWVQAVSHALFGTNLFALRVPTFVAFAAVLAVFWQVAKRIGREHRRRVFLRSTLVFVASPIYGLMGTIAMHDYLLVALVIAAGYFFTCYLTEVEEGGRGRLGLLFAAAVLLGLAGLTKYTAAFIGVAVAGVIVTRPKLRPMLLRWEIYAAALVSLLIQAPTLVWNLQNDFSSINFQLVRRFSDIGGGLRVDRMLVLVAEVAVLVSPVILVPVMARFFWTRQGISFERVGKTLAIWAFWIPALVFLYVQNFSLVLFWWSAVAFALVLPFSGRYVGAVALGIHVVWGGLIATFLTVSLAVVPLTGLMGRGMGLEGDRIFGWGEITSKVLAAQREHQTQLLAVNTATAASQLAFALDDPEVVAIQPDRNAFDDWFNHEAHRGEDAIVLVMRGAYGQAWKDEFESVQHLEDIDVDRFGLPLVTHELWLGHGYRPTP